MGKRLVALLCVSKLLLYVPAHAAERVPRLLTPAQLEEPEQVSAWLKQHAAVADQRRAAVAHDEGVRDAQRNSRGAALKGFGESALWFPTPQALNAYADAMQRFLGSLRAHRKDRVKHLDSDLRRFERLYRSALASDGVLSSLSAEEREQTSANADCIAAYRRTKAWQGPCAPLQTYGLRRN